MIGEHHDQAVLVVSLVEEFRLTIWMPGWNSSHAASAPARAKQQHGEREHRYIVPMSLWLVVVTQRISPEG